MFQLIRKICIVLLAFFVMTSAVVAKGGVRYKAKRLEQTTTDQGPCKKLVGEVTFLKKRGDNHPG